MTLTLYDSPLSVLGGICAVLGFSSSPPNVAGSPLLNCGPHMKSKKIQRSVACSYKSW